MSDSCGKSDKELTEEFIRLQLELRHKLVVCDTEDWALDMNKLELIGGLDISYDKSNSSRGCVTCVVLNAKNDFEIVYKNNTFIEPINRYIAGFLAFREISFLVKEYDTLKQNGSQFMPQVWLIDGNGVLHPRKFGLASHFGVLVDSAVIGVAKSPYYLNFVDQSVKDDHKRQKLSLGKVGDQFPITNSSDEVIGVALKTSSDCKNPVYVSIGHKVSLNTAITVVLKCCKYRVPEPVRQADIISRQLINQ